MNLYQLTSYQKRLQDQLNSGDFDPQTIADTLEAEGVGEQIDAKLEGYVIVAREFEAQSAARYAEAERMAKLAAQDNAKAKALLEAAKKSMETVGKLDVQTPLFHLKIAKNPPKCEVFGEVPEIFMVQKPAPPPSPSLTAIKDAIKKGSDCSAFAKMVQETKLKIS